jgi:opacity protein-like surface antigen
MKKLIATLLVAMLAMPSVMAGETDDLQNEIKMLKQQLQMLEQRLNSQETRTDRIAASTEAVEARAMQMEEDSLSMIEGWAQLKAVNDRVHIGGNIDVVGYLFDHSIEGVGLEDENDFYVDQLQLNIGLDIHDYVQGHVTLLYEAGPNVPFGGGSSLSNHDIGSGDSTTGELSVHEAYISIANPDGGLYLNVGRMYMPFGNYATNFILDTLPQQLGETRDTGVQVGYAAGALDVSYFAFNGTREQATSSNENVIDTWGLSANYAVEQEDMTLNVGAGYINNILQSQESRFNEGSGDYHHEVDAINVYATLQTGPIWASYEIVQAMRNDDDSSGSDQPSAQAAEVGLTVPLGEREYLIMAKYEDNDEQEDSSTIDYKWGIGVATDVYTNTRLTLNYENQRHELGGSSDPQDATVDWLAAELSISF